jgi:glycosyltransferase involved in cell wall biosynthesis
MKRKPLEQLIDKLELQATITGFCPEPENILPSPFICTSFLSEGFGIAVVEAMQQGLPCLCS